MTFYTNKIRTSAQHNTTQHNATHYKITQQHQHNDINKTSSAQQHQTQRQRSSTETLYNLCNL